MQARDDQPRSRDAGAESQAAYTLGRLTARRSVRAAMALSALRGGLARARQVWTSPAAVDAPTRIGRRLPYPELRVAHTGSGAVAALAAPTEPLDPTSWRTRLAEVRPDLVMIDGPGPLGGAGELRELVDQARQHDLPVVAVGPGVRLAEQAGIARDLAASLPARTDDDARGLDPWVDTRHANPMGLDHHPSGTWHLDPALAPPDLVREARHAAVVTAPLGSAGAEQHAAAVLHVLAAGTPCVAERTPLLDRLLAPHDDLLVTSSELADATAALLADDDLRERASVRLRRHVLSERTSLAAFEDVLDAVGMDRRARPTISVLLATRRADLLADALAAVDRQDHDAIEIQLLLHGISPEVPDRAVSAHRTLQVHRVPRERPLGAVLNVGLDAATGPLIAKMDDDDLYGQNHLRDLLVALTYSGAEAVGRWSNVVYLDDRDRTVHQHIERQERWAHHLPGATLLVHGDVLRELRWRLVPRGVDTELVRSIHGAGGRCYGTHRFGFIRRRHGDHTFDRSERAFEAEGRAKPGLDRSVLTV